MYINIRMLMIANHITFNDIAKVLGISRNSACNKINGKAVLTVDDVNKLKSKLFTNATYEELIKKDETK